MAIFFVNFLGWFESTKDLTNDDHIFLDTTIFVSESPSLISLCIPPLIITATFSACSLRRGVGSVSGDRNVAWQRCHLRVISADVIAGACWLMISWILGSPLSRDSGTLGNVGKRDD